MRSIVALRVVCCSCHHEVPRGNGECPRCGNNPATGYFLYLNDHEMDYFFPEIELAERRG